MDKQNNPLEGPGSNLVNAKSIIIFSCYIALLTAFLLYFTIQFWPQTPTGDPPTISQTVTLFSYQLDIDYEIRLLIIVVLTGAIGGQIHVLRSFWRYVGRRELKYSWLMMYLLKPLIGSTLGLILYFFIRGGFFTNQSIQLATPFGFAAVSALAGMFTDNIIDVLKKMTDIIFKRSEETKEGIKKDENENKESV